MDKPLYGLILAGGKSTRMGRDKSTLVYHHGKDQVRYLYEVLSPSVDRVFVSIRNTQRYSAHLQGYDTIEDARHISSPLNGILSAMDRFPEASWLVLAVDMPNIDKNSIKELINMRNIEFPATCFNSPVKGGLDPLFAIWEAHAKTKIEALIAKDAITCPRNMLTLVGAYLVQDHVDANVLRNINTPQEYREALS